MVLDGRFKQPKCITLKNILLQDLKNLNLHPEETPLNCPMFTLWQSDMVVAGAGGR